MGTDQSKINVLQATKDFINEKMETMTVDDKLEYCNSLIDFLDELDIESETEEE